MNRELSVEASQNQVAYPESVISMFNHAGTTLRDTQDPLRIMLDTTPLGIVLIDYRTRVIVDANAPAIRMINSTKEALVGRICHRFICPSKVGRCPVIDLGKTKDKAECTLIRADGESIHVLKSVTLVKLNARRYLVEIFVDLSDLRRAKEVLEESYWRPEQALV